MSANTSIPGVVIAHSPAKTRCYTQCPAIVKLPDGNLVASHSWVGPGTTNTDSSIYRSDDDGLTWKFAGHLTGQVWSNLFCHDGFLYIMGTDHRNPADGRLNGRIVIRRSDDQGCTWTTPTGADSGLLTDDDGWHTAPVPVVTHGERVWRAFEFAPSEHRSTWRPLVLSAPAHSDLLRRSNWTFSEQYAHDPSDALEYIEGNVVVSPDGNLVDIVRVNSGKSHEPPVVDKAMLLHVGDDAVSLGHQRPRDVIDFPGGGSKFTIRYDEKSGRYLSLVNGQSEPNVWRNVLYLASSTDLRSWTIDRELLRHPAADTHAFQYVDWTFDGTDIIYVSRTAFDDRMGGAHNAHDANFITFHRLERFRDYIG